MRTGPFTVKVLSNVPWALGSVLHPASSPAANKVAQAATAIQPRLCKPFIVYVRRFVAGLLGARNAGTRPPFLREIYEKAQPEVPARTTLPRRPSLNLQKGIERPLPVTFQIQSRERKSGAFHARSNLARNLRIKSQRQFLPRDVDPSQLTIRAHAKLPKSKGAKTCSRTIDLLQHLRRHSGA